MSERKIIDGQIAKKTLEIQALEEKLKTAKIYVKALEDVIKVIERGGSVGSEDGEATLRKGSLVAQARDVIMAKGEPVYIDDLLRELGKEVSRDTKASLAGSLAAYVRKNDIFTRPKPSTFGLMELEHFEVEQVESQPPQGFGDSAPAGDIDDGIPF